MHFDSLHPALQHHIVNSLGWRDLRPFQDAVIPHALAGEHLIVLAPTAGGKTEAAFGGHEFVFFVLIAREFGVWEGALVPTGFDDLAAIERMFEAERL